MFVVHKRTGYLGMIMWIKNGTAAMQKVNNGALTRATIEMLRPAIHEEIKAAGLSGVGCVEPPE
jgi:hypothetical protein